eukprot:TRINITY_DN3479_c0_g1_i10.p1 TRINITY_DN3479_c0_g1~~TRINITY_DN3479_c0_g1_i10.p1  ORF type:complete len:195 (+),score=40.13 TRINITY_DN3479_c0_g1_i10:179-763(+)
MSSNKKSSSSSSKSKDKKTKKTSSKESLCSRTASILASSQNCEEAEKNLTQIRLTVAGDGVNEPVQSQVAVVVGEVITCDFLPQICVNLVKLNSDARRDVGLIFNKLLKFPPVVEYLVPQREMIQSLVDSYGDVNLSLPISLIFAEILRYEPLCRVMLDPATFFPFFPLIQSENFDIATNSFGTFKVFFSVTRF